MNVVGSYPGVEYCMDFSHIVLVVKIVTFEKTKINEKEAGDGPFKKQSIRPILPFTKACGQMMNPMHKNNPQNYFLLIIERRKIGISIFFTD